MKRARILVCLLPFAVSAAGAQTSPAAIFGFHKPSQQSRWDSIFLSVPNAERAGEELKVLTAAPHWASSPEDYTTAQYVADQFRSAGLRTEIVPYRVRLSKPVSVRIEAFDDKGNRILDGPTREHVDPLQDGGDPGQNDPRILPIYNSSSPSGDVTAPVVYANYGTQEDFRRLAQLGISVQGRIVLVRYGRIFRGTKVYLAQHNGARGVLIYSDPADDGFLRGPVYPKGPFRPKWSAERGSVQFLPIYPGDPDTPGIASTPNLPSSRRLLFSELRKEQPSIPANPLSYGDAEPILRALGGPVAPSGWQGGLPFPYHLGPGKVTVHMHIEQDNRLRTIWDVIGVIPGTDRTRNWVIAGNHRDAWVYGAADPGSGTVAMLEAVHGLGELLRRDWRPRRTIVIASWDAEEEGLIGSTEWVEQHMRELARAVAYFNTDIAVSGPEFNAAAVPSLKQFVREVTREVPSPAGGSVYDEWHMAQTDPFELRGGPDVQPLTVPEVRLANLGSGSDYTPFLQHAGVPSTDIGSSGAYGVYHSTFDDYNWFIHFADPSFVYLQQQARVFGLEILHMASADVLPYNEADYGHEIFGYLEQAMQRAMSAKLSVNFTSALSAADRFQNAGKIIHRLQMVPPANPAALNTALRSAEEALLYPAGLPGRPWYKHLIFAPGELTGYEAVVIPGVNEAISARDATQTRTQLGILTDALNRAAKILEAVQPPAKPQAGF